MTAVPCLKLAVLSALALLAACAAPAPVPSVGEIVVSSASFAGTNTTQIFSDGTVIRTTANPGLAPIRSITHTMPDSYRNAAAVLMAKGLVTRNALKPQAKPCLDYGTDQVTAVPAVGGFDTASATCPDAALSGLMSDVLATLGQP